MWLQSSIIIRSRNGRGRLERAVRETREDEAKGADGAISSALGCSERREV